MKKQTNNNNNKKTGTGDFIVKYYYKIFKKNTCSANAIQTILNCNLANSL